MKVSILSDSSTVEHDRDWIEIYIVRQQLTWQQTWEHTISVHMLAAEGVNIENRPLHEVVVRPLGPLTATFLEYVFPWYQNKRDLWREFQTIQEAAKLTSTLSERLQQPRLKRWEIRARGTTGSRCIRS